MYLPYLFKELYRRKSRTVINILTVSIIVIILILITTLMNAYTSASYISFNGVDSNLVLQKSGNSTNQLSNIQLPFGKDIFGDSEINDISNLDHVKDISKSIILWNFKKNGFESIEGVNPDDFYGKSLANSTTGRFLSKNETRKAVIESHFAKFNNLKAGDSIYLNNKSFEIIGLIKDKEQGQIFSSNIYILNSDAWNISGINGFNQVYLEIDSISNEKLIKTEINQIDAKINVYGSPISTSYENLLEIYNKFYLFGIGIIILISILVLFKINVSNLLERQKDIAVLQSVGWTKKEVSKQVTLEVLIQNIMGFIIGIFLSILIIYLIGSISVQSSSVGIGETNILSIPLIFPTISGIEYFALVLVVTLLVSYLLIKKISSIKPLENLRKI